MALLARLRHILFASLHDAFNHLEKPARLLNYQILALREQLDHAREQVAVAMAAERRLATQATDAERAEEQWEQRARRAVEHREDELAREALRRKRTAKELAAYYHRAHEQQYQAVVGLRASLKRLEMRLLEFKAKRAHMLAKLETAQAQRMISRSLRQAVGTDAFEIFNRIAFQSDSELQQALALTELFDDPDEAFVVAERDSGVEIELTSLKRELGFRRPESEPRALEERGERW